MVIDGFQDVKNANAVARILKAITEEGHPEVWRQYPILGTALESLRRVYRPPVFSYALEVQWFFMGRRVKTVETSFKTMNECTDALMQFRKNEQRGVVWLSRYYEVLVGVKITQVGYEEGHNG